MAVAAAALGIASPLGAQGGVGQAAAGARALSLAEALRIAEDQSEQVNMARASVLRARGQEYQARSERYPQVGATLSYTRTLASEFEGAFGGGSEPDSAAPPPLPACDPFTPNPALPLEERLRQVEAQFTCDDNPLGALDFGDLPFGRENVWRWGLSVSQNLFAGGRLTAQGRVAEAGRATADVGLRSARAQLVMDVTQAYYDAVLSDRLVGIAESTLRQSEATLQQTRLARQVGNQPEFELLRAQVTRDNQQPVVIQRRADRDLAYLRLKQLLNFPLDQPLALSSDLGDVEPGPVVRPTASAQPGAPALAPEDTAVAARAPVRQAEEAVRVQEGQLAIARSQSLPSVALSTQYGRVGYPSGPLPSWGDFRENWTVGVSLQVPLFTGGRIRGEKLVAQANLDEARARLQQVRELAALDAAAAYDQLAAASASFQASTGTVGQAARAYQIAEIRYREGLSTQVELTDSRILMQQAEANRATAARNLQVARARVALLRDLPLGTAGAAGAAGQPDAPQQPQQQAPARQAPRQPVADASQTGIPGAGGL